MHHVDLKLFSVLLLLLVAAVLCGHCSAQCGAGKVVSFGPNFFGALGDNSTTDRKFPVEALISNQNITKVAAGTYHSLVLSESGKLFAFGYNDNGQLGDGTTTNRWTLVSVVSDGALSGLKVVSVAGGGLHSLALADNGQVFSFGDNQYGGLGDGTNTDRNIPVAVSTSGVLSGKTITAISAGYYHSLVLSATGQVFSFGYNNEGELGDGTSTDSNIPVAVDTSGVLFGKTITGIAAGALHSLVLSSSGQVFSFGYNSEGELGDGTTTSRYSPVAVYTSGVLFGKTITAIAAGYLHSLVLSSTGEVFSFGLNGDGELGDGTNTNKHYPVAVSTSGVLNGKTITAIAAGVYHSLVLSGTGQVFSFGDNSYGQLGDGTTTDRYSPVAVDKSGVLNERQISSISTGYHSLLLTGGPESPVFFEEFADPEPIDGMYFITGTSTNISWTTSDEVSADAQIIIDLFQGTTNISRLFNVPNTVQTVRWNMGNLTPGFYRLRMSNSTTTTCWDSYSPDFEITAVEKQITSVDTPQPYLFVGQPNVPISWQSTSTLGNVKIELIREGNPIPESVTENSLGVFPFIWSSVSTSRARQTDFRFQISSLTFPSVAPATSDVFEIDTKQKRYIIQNPTGSLGYLLKGTTCDIKWSSEGFVGSFVKIELWRNESFITVAANKSVTASPIQWTFDAFDGVPRDDYFFKISSLELPYVSSKSALISVDTVQKTLTSVDTPPTFLFVGQSDVSISWQSTGHFGILKIELIRDGDSTVDVISANYSGSSPFIWSTVTASGGRQTDYRFRVSSPSFPSLVATSQQFEIDIEPKTIEVMKLSQSYLFVGQSDVSISWSCTGFLGDVVIELIRDGNDTSTVDVLSSRLYSRSSPFMWSHVEASDSRRSDYRFRISAFSFPSVIGVSPTPFEIDSVFKNITSVEKPSTTLHVDQTEVSIRWTSSGYLGDVMIELIRDGNNTIDVIAANHTGGSPFVWPKVECSDVGREDFRFRVQSLTFPEVAPASSGTFQIDVAVNGASAMMKMDIFRVATSGLMVIVGMLMMQCFLM